LHKKNKLKKTNNCILGLFWSPIHNFLESDCLNLSRNIFTSTQYNDKENEKSWGSLAKQQGSFPVGGELLDQAQRAVSQKQNLEIQDKR